ncbi:MAG: hypothetical protein FWF59_01190, partial [Turicibacter sp.]|nr:hypothetical protein [Turicibacter sp.]
MKKLKYLALLGLAGDLLLSPLGLAVAVFGSQYRGGIAEEVYEAMDVEEYEPLMADERLYDVFEEDGLEISEEEYLYEGRDVEAEDADAGDSDELVFLTREEALLLSDEEIRELGGEVMEAERISPFARHFGDENVPWRELAAYNACPNRNGDGSFILNAIIVDSPNAEGTNVAATQCVNTAAALNAAWNHNAVRRIIMMADITLAASDAITRNTSLEFDGNGRRPDGRPSGNGAGGDGFTLTQPALTHTLNLGAAAGAGGAEVGLGLTAVTNDTVNIPFQDGGGALLHFHSVVVASPSTAGLTGNPAGAAFINSTVPWYYSNNPAAPARRNRTGTWRFRFGNVRSNGVAIEGRDAISGRVTDWSIPQTSGQAGIQRFLRAPQAEVTFYGDVLLNTRGQNAYVGKVLVEDDALLVGNMSAGYNDFYGNIWFNVRMHGETTGSDPSCGRLTVPEGTDCRNSVVLGRGARAIFTSTTALSHAPAVHGHWRNLVIGEQATFETSQNAPAIAFNSNIANTGGIESVRNATQTVRVHSGGRLVATRRDVGPVIHNVGPNVTNAGGLVASNALIDIRPGGELYVLGNTTAALINLTGINNRLQVEAGALVDLRNENAAGTSRLFERGGNYRFENMGEAILWTTSGGNAMNTRPATHSFSHVADLAITGTAAAGIVSSDPGLQSTLRGTANFRRLVTTTQSPTISHIEPVTEGDTTISGRVIWPDIPVSLGVGNGIIGRGIPMGPLVGSFGRSILLNDTFHPAWVRQYSYAEGYEHEEPERYLSGLVPGNALTVPLDEDGSFTHATQPQEAGAYIMARLNDGDDGVSTWVSFPEDGIGEGMVFDPDYDTYDEDGQGLMFITSAESRSWTDQQVREAGGGVSRPAPAINPQSLARNTVPWRDLAPHNA